MEKPKQTFWPTSIFWGSWCSDFLKAPPDAEHLPPQGWFTPEDGKPLPVPGSPPHTPRQKPNLLATLTHTAAEAPAEEPVPSHFSLQI